MQLVQVVLLAQVAYLAHLDPQVGLERQELLVSAVPLELQGLLVLLEWVEF